MYVYYMVCMHSKMSPRTLVKMPTTVISKQTLFALKLFSSCLSVLQNLQCAMYYFLIKLLQRCFLV